jgi:enoyl-CoA hydratase
MTSQNLVIVERPDGAIARVTLNRPDKKNALSIALRDALTATLETLAADDSVRVVLLTGAGGAFSAGFDLDEFGRAMQEPGLYDRIWASSDPYHERLLRFPLPMVAAVDGIALGGGMDTAVLCDVRVASTRASFGHPEASFGDVVYAPLHDLIGGAAARELCLTGRRIDAAEALRLGLVSEVVPPDQLADRALAVAGVIARAPRDLLMRTKAKIIARAAIPFTTTLAL